MQAKKQYASKTAIYKDYAIAVRLVLENYGSLGNYDVIDGIAAEHRLRIEKYDAWVENYLREKPLSLGFYVEVPVTGDTGEAFGVRLVLLGHENGPEVFLPEYIVPAITAVGAVAGWVGLKVADKVWDRVLAKRVDDMIAGVLKRVYNGIRVKHVEIRTAQKGVLNLPFSVFSWAQIRCVLANFGTVEQLEDLISPCFGSVEQQVTFVSSLENTRTE